MKQQLRHGLPRLGGGGERLQLDIGQHFIAVARGCQFRKLRQAAPFCSPKRFSDGICLSSCEPAKDSPHRPVTSSSILLTECPKRPYTTHICAVRFLQLTLIGCPTAATSQRQVRISNHKRACGSLSDADSPIVGDAGGTLSIDLIYR